MLNKALQILRIGRINRLAVPVITPRIRLPIPDTFIGIGIGVHETSDGPALAITVAGADQVTATAIITPDNLGSFMALMTESSRRLADTLIPPPESVQ